MTIQLNIGSNIGDRYAQIEQAVALLSIAFRSRDPEARVYRSSLVESAPWGFTSPNSFLNLGLKIETTAHIEPLDVLDITQGVEHIVDFHHAGHRNSDGSYRDRRIDIDIIDIDGCHLSTARLTLPHPLAGARPFVMDALKELS